MRKVQFKQFCPKGHDTFVVGRTKSGNCKECARKAVRKWWKNNPEKAKEAGRKWNEENPENARECYWRHIKIINVDGSQFTILNYDRLYQIQSGRCKICSKHSTEFKRRLAVDHDHKTGIVRGLLCYRCNIDVGVLENKKQIIEKYLASSKVSISGASNDVCFSRTSEIAIISN